MYVYIYIDREKEREKESQVRIWSTGPEFIFNQIKSLWWKSYIDDPIIEYDLLFQNYLHTKNYII